MKSPFFVSVVISWNNDKLFSLDATLFVLSFDTSNCLEEEFVHFSEDISSPLADSHDAHEMTERVHQKFRADLDAFFRFTIRFDFASIEHALDPFRRNISQVEQLNKNSLFAP